MSRQSVAHSCGEWVKTESELAATSIAARAKKWQPLVNWLLAPARHEFRLVQAVSLTNDKG